jgi:predicted nucleotide-binding protein (sugar kinase/HSP70/actin superfamily)
MITRRTLLVGGLGSIHDPLLAAALRGVGFEAVALHPATNTGMFRARGLGNHGQCNPAHYSAGAVVEQARRSTLSLPDFAGTHAWLTLGSCGPCRLSSFALEYARVLECAGLGALPVVFLEQLGFVVGALETPLERLEQPAAQAAVTALATGDAIAALGRFLRPYALDPDAVERLLDCAVGSLACALETGQSVQSHLRELGQRSHAICCDFSRIAPSILLVGEPWATLIDGDPSYDLVRRLGQHGAEVDAPSTVSWLRFRLWEEARRGRAARVGGLPEAEALAMAGADDRLFELARTSARALGMSHPSRNEQEDVAALAAPHYVADVRGGSVHLEIGRALRALRDRTAHHVVSLKPFGCLPSSGLSDSILGALAERRAAPPFIAIESTGDADATVESRIEMTLDTARTAAEREFASALAELRIRRAQAFRELARLPAGTRGPGGPRRYACTAAELLARARVPASRA